MKNSSKSIIESIESFTEYVKNHNIDTSLLSEWSEKREAQLDGFIKFCYTNNLVPGDYDSQDNKGLLKSQDKLQYLNIEESTKLLGYIIRSEYWGAGLFARSIDDGTLIILLNRLVFLLK